MGPINSLDPPAGALSNPSNGKEAVSVLDWCQGSVKSSSTHPDARYKMQDARWVPQRLPGLDVRGEPTLEHHLASMRKVPPFALCGRIAPHSGGVHRRTMRRVVPQSSTTQRAPQCASVR